MGGNSSQPADEPATQESVKLPQDFPTPLPCKSCSYDLRGSPISGVCPECGTPYELSDHLKPSYLGSASSEGGGVFKGVMLTGLILLAIPGLLVVLAFGACMISMP